MLDTHPARSLNDLRARMSWLEFLSRKESSWTHQDDLIRFATLRADIERMAARLRDQDGAAVQNGKAKGSTPDAYHVRSPDPASSSVAARSGHPRRTKPNKRADVLALLNDRAGETGAAPLTDREIARRAGVSPTTVGAIRKSLRN